MAIIDLSILVKTMIEAGLADLRKNQWLLHDVFAGLAVDPLAKKEFGYKEVTRAINWFLNQNIPVVHTHRVGDDPVFPCITVMPGGDSEILERTNLSDFGEEEDDFDPRSAQRLPDMVYKPFTPSGYDPQTGAVTMPDGLNTDLVVPGQYFVSKKTNKGYQILKCLDSSRFEIASGITEDFTMATIIPPNKFWNVNREFTYFNHSIKIGCYAQSDPVQAIWLTQLTSYLLLRYKEAWLDARGFELSTFSVGPLRAAGELQPENVFARDISLSGQQRADWIKYIAPKFQSVGMGMLVSEATATPDVIKNAIGKQLWKMAADEPGADDGEE